MEAGLNPGGDH